MVHSAPSLEEFTGLMLTNWDGQDIALLNLMSARGLPGTNGLDVAGLLERLDEWADRVRFEICRHLYRFDPRSMEEPSEFNYGNSLGRFFCYFLLQVLQEDCGVVYHPDRKFSPDFCQPEDLFIHGIVTPGGRGGTCASMPVVYVAVGRRLGFPVFLVETRGHLFFRWDDPRGTIIRWQYPDLNLWVAPDRFNVEGAGEGIAYYSDSHYLQWPELWSQADFEHGCYLRSLTPQEELSSFLIQRAECFHDLGNRLDALKSIYFARMLSPDDIRFQQLHALRTRQLQEHEQAIARLEEMEREQHRRRRSLQGLPGHPRNCPCAECAYSKGIAPSGCGPFHGMGCQCFHCKQARQALAAASQQGGFPDGRPPHSPLPGFPPKSVGIPARIPPHISGWGIQQPHLPD